MAVCSLSWLQARGFLQLIHRYAPLHDLALESHSNINV
jgi:hypothetical protein